jgi:hypothetical protein
MILYIRQLKLGSHPVAVVQYTFTHKQHTEQHKNNRTTQITTNLEECWPCPVFASFTLAFALQLRKKHGKTSVRVASPLPHTRYMLRPSNSSRFYHPNNMFSGDTNIQKKVDPLVHAMPNWKPQKSTVSVPLTLLCWKERKRQMRKCHLSYILPFSSARC